jgi:DNA-binding transcriptional regulator of glucitol operon
MTWMGIAAAVAVAVAGWWQVRRRNATLALLQQRGKLLTQALAATGLSASHFDLRTGTLTRSSPEGLVSTTVPLGPDVFERLFEPLPDAERARLTAYVREVIAGEAPTTTSSSATSPLKAPRPAWP